MKSVTKLHKQQWFKISKVIELLKKRNVEYDFSAKYILKNANLYESKDKYPDIQFSSRDNISVYYFSKEIISASILNNDIDTEFCLGEIEFSGYIRLEDRYIQELLDNEETMINGFFPPTQEDRNIRNIFHQYKQDADFDWGFANSCTINKEDRPQLSDSDINNLFIYRTDAVKLVKHYKKIISKNYTCIQVSEIVEKKKHNKFQLNNYKKAAANCLARLLWQYYPDILPKDLSKFWAFHIIHSYKFQTCCDNDLKTKYNKCADSEDNASIDPCYSTINSWIKDSCPDRLIINGQPRTELALTSNSCLKKLKFDQDKFENLFLDIIIRSIESYNTTPTRVEFEGQLDLTSIIYKIKDKDPVLKDDNFWELLFKDAGLSIVIMEVDIIKG